MRKTLLAPSSLAAAAGASQASIDIYTAALYGVNECGGTPLSCGTFGDPDGYGAATVMIDNVANTVQWSIVAFDIGSTIVGAHIHQGAAGTNGPVRIDFDATFMGKVTDPDAAGITPSTALGWYVNVHTPVYPGGAIRGQLTFERTVTPVPEPAAMALMLAGLGVVGGAACLRRRG